MTRTPANSAHTRPPAHSHASAERRTLYPDVEAYRTGTLRVSDLHEIYFEESGNPEGKPVVFVHGGPGGGTEPKQRRFFDPRAYRIVLGDACHALHGLTSESA